jgi:tetratricopeptide (TPR) repeat protein
MRLLTIARCVQTDISAAYCDLEICRPKKTQQRNPAKCREISGAGFTSIPILLTVLLLSLSGAVIDSKAAEQDWPIRTSALSPRSQYGATDFDSHSLIVKEQIRQFGNTVREGLRAKRSGDQTAALNFFDRALALYRALRQYDRAIEDYSRAIELDHRTPSAYRYRGWIYEQKDLPDQARADFQRANEIGIADNWQIPGPERVGTAELR